METSLLKILPPKTEKELLERCLRLQGVTFAQLARSLSLAIPTEPSQRKGWVGMALELALGANASNKALPDFMGLGIELKTLPIGSSGKPVESTFVTSIPLLSLHQQTWKSSQCYVKLKRVLWLPIEGDNELPYLSRRIGKGFLWSPDEAQESQLSSDWEYLSFKITTGQLETIDASVGVYLQVRPKAAHGKSLCHGFDSQGIKIQTLPRGFYLRSSFTHQIFSKA